MVLYDRRFQAAPAPAPSCPTCGSRHTEVVGRSNDDSVAAEIEAMSQVARALGSLDDAKARARVLRWAIDRYQVDTMPPAAPATTLAAPAMVAPAMAAPIVAAGTDPTLEVESLSDLFSATSLDLDAADLSVADPQKPAHGTGIESMIRGFAADFRRFAREWQGA